jgi:hypothetical protein
MNRLIRDKGASATLAIDAILPERDEAAIILQEFLDALAKSRSGPSQFSPNSPSNSI